MVSVNDMFKLVKKTGHFKEILLIILLGCLSFTWVEDDLIISGGDLTFNFSPLRNFERYYSTWNDGVGAGYANVQAMPQMVTFQSFFAIWQLIGLPLFLAQRILFFFLFTSGGLSMYFLTITVLEEHERKLAGLVAAVYYMLNPFTLVIMWGVPAVLIFFYPAIPLLLALYIRGINSERSTFYVFLLCFSSSIVFSAAYSVATFAITSWLLFSSYFFFYILSNIQDYSKKYHAIKFTLLLFLSWILLNLYWILPYLHSIKDLTSTAAYIDSGDILKGTSSKAGLVNTFRLFGYPVFNLKFMDIDFFYPYSPTYSTLIFIFLSFLAPIIIFSSLLIKRKDRSILFFSVFSLAVLFFFKGSQPPFGGIYFWMMEYVPLMTAFRNPLDKFGSLLPVGFSLLLGVTVAKFFFLSGNKSKYHNKERFSVLILCISLFLVFMFPFWTGQVFEKGGMIRPSWHVKVPDYYNDADLWLSEQNEVFRIFPLPLMDLFGTPFNWEHGHGGGDPRQFIFNKPLLGSSNNLAQLASSYLAQKTLNAEEKRSVARMLGLLNVKYVLLSEDIKEDYFNIEKTGLLNSKSNIINEIFPGIKLKKSFGRLFFYELSGDFLLPKIYAPESVINVAGNFTYGTNSQLISATMPAATSYNNNTGEKAIFLLGDSSPKIMDIFKRYKTNETRANYEGYYLRIRTAIGLPTPNLVFQRINPTKYRVTVKATEPFLLVFSENYNKNWNAYMKPDKFSYYNVIGGTALETFQMTPLNESLHFKVNGYANAWWIEPEQNAGNATEIIIEFATQKHFYLGFAVSILTFLVLLISTGIVYKNESASSRGENGD